MGAPDQPDDFVRLQAGDLTIYLARDIWEQLKPGQSKLLVAVSGYGRFWLHLFPRRRAPTLLTSSK
jgi:hypothetical protein